MKENTKEIISYVFVGIMTTLVNYIVYFVLLMIHCHWLVANSISWFFAVIFAYYANTLMHIQPMFSKLLVSFVTILSNYVLCKFKIFKKEGVYNG